MAYDVICKIVGLRPLTAARSRVRIGEVVNAVKPALDEVWAVLYAHPELKPGHNIFL